MVSPVLIFLLVVLLLGFTALCWRICEAVYRASEERHRIQVEEEREALAQTLETIREPIKLIISEPGVEVGNLEINAEFKCPVCGEIVKASEKIGKCVGCGTPAHKECFEYNKNCAVYGCASKDFLTKESCACRVGHACPCIPLTQSFNLRAPT